MKFCNHCGGFFEDDETCCPNDGRDLRQVTSEQGDDSDPLIGTVLDGRFLVQSRLGAGGMGAVYRALQASTRREVALKVILGKLTDEGAKRFMREAHTTSALCNVHTVTIFDFGRAPDGTLYLAMELLEGQPLDEVLEQEGALPWARAVYLLAQVAESLAEAHGKGIIHRDLKPANIFLACMGEDPDFVKVLDFGIAKLQGQGITTELTGAGMILGTPAYMSPEQARGEVLGPGSDIYSLGVVLYEMLAGRPPFESDTPVGLLIKHIQDPVPRLDELRPSLRKHTGLLALLSGMLEKKAEERIGMAAELQRRALELLRTPRVATLRPVSASSSEPPDWAALSEEIGHAPSAQTGAQGPRSTWQPPDSTAKTLGIDSLGPEGQPGLVDQSTLVDSRQGGALTPTRGDGAVRAGEGPDASGPSTREAVAAMQGKTRARVPILLGGLAALVITGVVVAWALLGRGPGGETASSASEDPRPDGGSAAVVLAARADAAGADTGSSEGHAAGSDARAAAQARAADATSERSATLAAEVSEARAAAAKVTIESTPSRAEVRDAAGNALGRTPLELPRPLLATTLSLHRKGYRAGKLQLGPKSEASVTVRLRRKPRARSKKAQPRRMDQLLRKVQ